VFRFPAAAAAAVVYKPGAGRPASTPSSEGRAAAAAVSRPDYARIATQLRTPAQVLECVRAAAHRSNTLHETDPPRTALERDLVALWMELLNVSAVGIHDSFFELGGHSLLAVQLLARVRQIYSVDLTLEVVYSGEFTVAELAKAVELKEIEQAGGDYHELLAELEAMTDEEVRALLAEEQDAN
jgi:hypothetical protein